MTPAEHARNAAISLEAKKDALSQRQSGDWKVTFTVQGIDMDPRLTQAPMGTRYAVVLVEIGDDELPVQKEPRATPRQTTPKPDGAKRGWQDVPAPQQAGIRIGQATFAAYLREEHSDEWNETGDPDSCLKLICRINSKREFLTNHKAYVLWRQIDGHYDAWLAKERVGA